MKIIKISLLLITLFSLLSIRLLCAEESKQALGVIQHNYDLREVNREAERVAVTQIGLSSTGKVEYICPHVVSTAIRGFAEAGDVVFEYKTTHLFNQTLSLFWYNPKNGQVLILLEKGIGGRILRD